MMIEAASAQIETAYPVLAGLPVDLRQSVLAAMQIVEVPAGAVLFDERQPCRGFPFVLAGAIRVIKSAPNGRELPLYRVLPGESCLITSSCLLGAVAYNARGLTEAPTTLALLPPSVFDALLDQPTFRQFVFHLFSERLAELMQLVEEVAFHKLDQRLASLLLGKGRMVHATHQQLADELGSMHEIVSRLLKNFAEQGAVQLVREQIEILDAQHLRKIASVT